MKESNTLEGNVTSKQQQKEIFRDTKVQDIKESNNHAGNAIIKQHQKEFLLNTKGHYLKESTTHVCNATINQATSKGDIARHKNAMHEGFKYPCRQCNNLII